MSEGDDSWLEDFRDETDDELGDAPPGFLLDELLGRGGMAEVYLAHRTGPKGFSRKVVIKRIRPDKVNDRDFVERFVREASLTSKFHHPNIVEIMELVTLDDSYFIVMEYLNGKPINSLVDTLNKRRTHFPQELAAFTVAGLAGAIDYAHNFVDEDGKRHQIVHRDISPDNVFITYGGEVKLLDFGVAKDLDGTQMTQGDQVIGKPLYLPPESLQGAPASPARDVYSLGMTLYVMLAGRPPFEMASGPEGLAKLLMDITSGAKAPPPSDLNPNIDPALEHIVMKSIAPEPSARYTAAALKSVLEGWLTGAEPAASSSILSDFMREFGGPNEGQRANTGKKSLKALGSAQARGGWQQNRAEDRKRAPKATAHIPDSDVAPMPVAQRGGTQLLEQESVVKPAGQSSTLLLESDSIESPLEQETKSHPSAEIDPRSLEPVQSDRLPPVAPQAPPRVPTEEPAPLKALESYEPPPGAFAPPSKKRGAKRKKKRPPKRTEPVDRGKAFVGAVFLAVLVMGLGLCAYFVLNPRGDPTRALEDEIATIKASLEGQLRGETEPPSVDDPDDPQKQPDRAVVANPESSPPEPESEPEPAPAPPQKNAFLAVRCDGTWIYVDGAQVGSCSLGSTRIRVTPGRHVVEVETVGGMLRARVRVRANRTTPVRLKKKRVIRKAPDEVVRVPTD